MNLLKLILLTLPSIACLASGSRTPDVFASYHSKFQSVPPLKLDDNAYDQLTASPRNYSVAVLLTALEARFGCSLCRDFQPEWDILAKSWARGDKKGESRVLFGTLDFSDGKAVFQKLMLQTAPVLLLFPPTQGPNARPDGQPSKYEFTAGPQSAEQIRAWMVRFLPDGPKPSVVRPPNYVRIITLVTTSLAVLSILSVTYPYVLPVSQSRHLWAVISILLVLLFTSGHMFNHIRKVPYVVGDGKGGISYFAGGFSTQFGMETQIVAAIYGVLSFGIIALAIKAPRYTDLKKQNLAIFAWVGTLLVVYSFLLSVFKIKNGGYPFRLLPALG